MSRKTTLNSAKKDKKDEFYTQYEDIEREISHYIEHFRNKIIYCNCDNAEWSNFYKYFKDNFHKLQLKQLISTYYLPETIDTDGAKVQPEVFKTIYDGIKETKIKLSGNGDFNSQECIDILKEADIVATNPPFSLFRSYVSQLIEYKKKFIIIGHQNAITYKEIFPLIKDNKLWLGYGFSGNVGFFTSPYDDIATASQHKEGKIRVSGVMWFTNIDHKKRHQLLPLDLQCTYKGNETKYLKYSDYNAINVDKTIDIPCDYNGIMGVPITFLDKYCPEQFEILECHEPAIDLETLKKDPKFKEYKSRQLMVNGTLCQKRYHRIFIKKKKSSKKGE